MQQINVRLCEKKRSQFRLSRSNIEATTLLLLLKLNNNFRTFQLQSHDYK